ncbi:MAG TPA: hypothetical protein VEQ37_14215 [Actinomycetota bacterium]|nr:hypothetical protein [Actinomycetota bacterium]
MAKYLLLLAERLQDLPRPELRTLFDSLPLQDAFQPQPTHDRR